MIHRAALHDGATKGMQLHIVKLLCHWRNPHILPYAIPLASTNSPPYCLSACQCLSGMGSEAEIGGKREGS